MTSIAFTGDISFSKYMTDSWKKEDLLDEKVTSFLHSADYVVANVECTLSDRPAVGGGLKHTSDPKAGAFIRDRLNARIWSLANNHILDCKAQGLLDTVQAAKDYGCQTIGAGANKEEAAKPVFIEDAGGIGIFSVVYDSKILRTADDEPGVLIWNETERIQKTIDQIKSRCRWCVMVVHGQNCEFTQIPLPISRERMKSFLKMGADVVVGHHPHVVQNYERFGKKMIFYSLGNFIFDTDYQRQRDYTQFGMLLKLNFTQTQWTWEYQPIRIDREENRIVAEKAPAIFTHIGPVEYHLLADLTYSDFIITHRAARMYVNAEKYGAYTAKDWYDYDARWMGTKGADRLRRGVKRAKLGLWKLARKELQQYIGKNLPFVKKEKDMTSIAFTGDISFTKYFKDAWKQEDLVDDQVLAFLHSADHVVANVECALSDNAVIGTGLKHASDPAAGQFVKERLGADIWTIANNHILDCGQQGLLDTLATARSFGCQTIGAGANKADAAKPVILEESGGIGIFSTVYTMDKYKTPEEEPGCLLWDDLPRIRETIAAIKAKCRWCVMVIHGGRGEFSQLPLPYVRSKMRSFLKMGVDVIVAHHPHVVQNYERFGKKMIFYSLGNFIFDTDYQRAQKYTDRGMLVKLDFTEDKVTFRSMACRVDRENNRIVPGTAPTVFTHIGPLQHYLLADLAIEDFIRNDFTSRNHVNPQKYGSFTPEEWNATYIQRWGEEATARIHRGRKAYKLGLWKLAKKELVDYIRKGF